MKIEFINFNEYYKELNQIFSYYTKVYFKIYKF